MTDDYTEGFIAQRLRERRQVRQLVRSLEQTLRAQVSTRGMRIEYVARVVTGQVEHSASLHDDEHVRAADMNVPAAAENAVARLRESMYNQNGGAWFQASITFCPDGAMAGDYEYDAEPTWNQDPPLHLFARDLARFPRRDPLPSWLEEKINGY